MVLLSEPDDARLWRVIAILFGISAVLLLGALSQPWYTASFTSGSAEWRGTYEFEDWTLAQFANDQEGRSITQAYGPDSAFGALMDQTRLFVYFGLVGVFGFLGLLAFYYLGYIENTTWIKATWLVGVVVTTLTVTYFAFNAGTAGRDEVVALAETQAQSAGYSLQAPEPVFWGIQDYAGGDLASAPGPGWFLAILAILNLIPPTILLFQFPESSGAADEDYAVDEDEAAEEKGSFRAVES